MLNLPKCTAIKSFCMTCAPFSYFLQFNSGERLLKCRFEPYAQGAEIRASRAFPSHLKINDHLVPIDALKNTLKHSAPS